MTDGINSHDQESISSDDIDFNDKKLNDLLNHLAEILANDYVDHMKKACSITTVGKRKSL